LGTVARLPSGRYIARWTDTDGLRCQAEQTFATTTDARAFLATVKADLLRKTYRAPRKVTETLAVYGARWVETRPRKVAASIDVSASAALARRSD
jgi:hypothetical protein